MSRDYAYFQGCSAKGSCRELDISTRAVASLFGINLRELADPGCTGAREFRAISERLHLAANGRILALAEAQECDLAVVCDTCLLNLTETNQRLRNDTRARERVNRTLSDVGLEYRGTTAVKHFLWILMEDIGEQRIRARVVRPLHGLRVAPFYGCHIRRPASVYGVADSDRAASLERLCEIVGAEPVPYAGASNCCGFHVLGVDQGVALRMSGGHLSEAERESAHCMVTPCPLCHTVLDAYQPDIERRVARPLRLPILHVSQLVGLAVGLSLDDLALSRHVVDAQKISDMAAGSDA
jgi:succinate dehydrogenase / fumarate reductase cytochrome b subunit